MPGSITQKIRYENKLKQKTKKRTLDRDYSKIHACMVGWMHVCIGVSNGWRDGRTEIWMDACMHVFVCFYICLSNRTETKSMVPAGET